MVEFIVLYTEVFTSTVQPLILKYLVMQEFNNGKFFEGFANHCGTAETIWAVKH